MVVLAYDIGTTGVKTCIFDVGETIALLGAAGGGYPLYVLPGGGAEQNPEDWWSAMRETTGKALARAGLAPERIEGISFCSQMQGVILVDRDGLPLRRAMSYMDQRAVEEHKKGIAFGLQIAGGNVYRLLKSLRYTGAASLSVKDPVWKYKWVEAHEPEVFAKTYKWLDVKEALIARMTGRCVRTPDSAFAALLYDIHKNGWSKPVADMLGVKFDHLPEIVPCESRVGVLCAQQASELGLAEGIPVFGGGGDASLVGVGAGAVAPGDTHIYCGTSGWVGTVVEKSMVDATANIAAIVGAQEGLYNYFAEQETAGKCLEWVKDTLDIAGYEELMALAEEAPIGAGGVLFAPWLHGNRCPFEDSAARGMFFGLNLDSGRAQIARAVAEGVVYHLRWMLETQDKKTATGKTVRFVGGGALNDLMCQMLADCTGRAVETVADPQNVGSVGAAALAAVGMGIIPSLQEVKPLIPAAKLYAPDMAKKPEYDRFFELYKGLYKANRKLFKAMQG
ncbi:MAG: FGGY-family carbohydrate kinase [Oscillospiraceae bacterium]|nr:FGGY-family carbohydrate kinase [Oscillospiraceae bacterium]